MSQDLVDCGGSQGLAFEGIAFSAPVHWGQYAFNGFAPGHSSPGEEVVIRGCVASLSDEAAHAGCRHKGRPTAAAYEL